MKKLANIALALALMTSTAAGAAALFPTNAVAMEQPWRIVTYLRGGVPVGNTQVFCSGREETWGDTTNYDDVVYTDYFMCP